jgi:hypothetical protein
MTHCPAHPDRHPSLKADWKNGKDLVHCHAGCTQAQVIAALRGRGLWGRPDYPTDDEARRLGWPTRGDLDARLARTAHLGRATKGWKSAGDALHAEARP